MRRRNSRSPPARGYQTAYRRRSRSPPRRRAEDISTGRQPTNQNTSHRHSGNSEQNINETGKPAAKECPNYGLSGLLAKDTSSVGGVVLKYHEPPEARHTTDRWRLYLFKGEHQIDTIHITEQSAYLFGREQLVVDILLENPTCSKQHAVLQYRQVSTAKDGSGTVVKPYLIDLDSANGTFINKERIQSRRYYELLPKDLLTFGTSTREYVLIKEP